MKFRKKPIVIEAIQWTGDNIAIILEFGVNIIATDDMGWFHFSKEFNPKKVKVLTVHTLEGPIFARIGDWIIRGVKGEFYPCKPDIFEQTYEAVND